MYLPRTSLEKAVDSALAGVAITVLLSPARMGVNGTHVTGSRSANNESTKAVLQDWVERGLPGMAYETQQFYSFRDGKQMQGNLISFVVLKSSFTQTSGCEGSFIVLKAYCECVRLGG